MNIRAIGVLAHCSYHSTIIHTHTHTHTDGGIDEMVDEMNSGKVLYAFLKVTDPNTELPKNVFVNWVSETLLHPHP